MPKPLENRDFTAKALQSELGRRRNNKKRDPEDKTRAQSWVFGGMSKTDINAVLEGDTVPVAFKKRVVAVSLRS